MNEKIKSDVLSRRSALSLLGAVLGLAATALPGSEADAQEATGRPQARVSALRE